MWSALPGLSGSLPVLNESYQMQTRDFFWLGCGLAAGFALGAAFPKLRKEFGPIIAEATERAREKASEVAAEFAGQVQHAQEQYATAEGDFHTHRGDTGTPDRAAS